MHPRSLTLLLALAAPIGFAQGHTVAEQYLFQSVNAERTAAGLPALVWNSALTAAAHRHAEQMRSEQAIAHQFRGEAALVDRAAVAGAHFSRVTENVATSDSILLMHTALMNSPHHRENILDPRVTSMGIAVVAARGQMWGVEDFSHDVQTLSFAQQETEVARQLAAAGLPNVEATQNARATCKLETGYVGARPSFVVRYTTGDLHQLPEQLTSRLTGGRYHQATIGACPAADNSAFTSYNLAVLLFP